VLLRLIQGIGLGSEWGGAVLVMTESEALRAIPAGLCSIPAYRNINLIAN
jgi:hypothetical protein